MKRTILAIELLILCGPALAFLLPGLLYSPAFIIGYLSGRASWQIGGLLIIFGTWGFISIANLALHVLRRKNWPGQPVQWFGLLCGIAASVIALTQMEKVDIKLLIFVGPIIALVHLLYLSKKCIQSS